MKHFLLLLLLLSYNFSVFSQQTTPLNLYVVKQNNKYGYIDSTGKIMIQPQFDYADDFVGEKARVLINGNIPIDFRCGLIDKKGSYILKPNYDYVRIQPNGFILAKQDSIWFIMDSTAKEIGKFKTPFVFFANGKIAIINKGDGYIGNIGFSNLQSSIKNLWDGNILGLSNEEHKDEILYGNRELKESWGIYNLLENEIYPPSIKYLSYNYKSNYITFSDEKSKLVGACDLNGKILSPKYYTLECISNSNLLIFGERKVIASTYTINKGVIDFSGKVISSAKYAEISNSLNDGLIRVEGNRDWRNNKSGFINISGKLVIDTIYQDAKDFSNGLAAIKQNNKWGYIDKNGTVFIPCIYLSIDIFNPNSFNDGLAIVNESDRGNSNWGVIDTTGRYIIPPSPQYLTIRLYNRFFEITVGDPNVVHSKSFPSNIYGYLNEENKMIVLDSNSIKYNDYITMANSNSRIKFEKRSFEEIIIDHKLNTIASTNIIDRGGNPLPFSYNLFNTKYGLAKIDYKNKSISVIDTTQYYLCPYYSEGLIWAYPKPVILNPFIEPKHLSGVFLDTNGRIVITSHQILSWNFLTENKNVYVHFSEGVCGISINQDSSVYIDKTGKIIIKLPYSEVGSFVNGFTFCKKGDKYAIMNRRFQTITPFMYNYLEDFSNGLALFKDENRLCGYIDTLGKIIIKPQFAFASAFNEGKADVTIRDKNNLELNGIINTKGEWILKPQSKYGSYLQINDSLAIASLRSFENIVEYSGIINSQEKIIVPFEYNRITLFNDGTIIGQKNEGKFLSYNFIDLQGKIINKIYSTDALELEHHENSDPITSKYALLKPIDPRHIEIGYYNSSGQCIWPVQY